MARQCICDLHLRLQACMYCGAQWMHELVAESWLRFTCVTASRCCALSLACYILPCMVRALDCNHPAATCNTHVRAHQHIMHLLPLQVDMRVLATGFDEGADIVEFEHWNQ